MPPALIPSHFSNHIISITTIIVAFVWHELWHEDKLHQMFSLNINIKFFIFSLFPINKENLFIGKYLKSCMFSLYLRVFLVLLCFKCLKKHPIHLNRIVCAVCTWPLFPQSCMSAQLCSSEAIYLEWWRKPMQIQGEHTDVALGFKPRTPQHLHQGS